VIGSSRLRAVCRARSGPNPVDRARPGGKHHFLVDGQDIPLMVSLTSGTRNDVTQRISLLDKIPAVSGALGRPRGQPGMVFADRGHDHNKHRRLLWQRGIRPATAERGQTHGFGLDDLLGREANDLLAARFPPPNDVVGY
jgi:hypothetical protein